jgi:hypothetical protein
VTAAVSLSAESRVRITPTDWGPWPAGLADSIALRIAESTLCVQDSRDEDAAAQSIRNPTHFSRLRASEITQQCPPCVLQLLPEQATTTHSTRISSPAQ